jgi:crossover junction endodeoxyribonuclease RusA
MKFTVTGTPIPQGSMRAFVPKHSHTGQPIITSDNPKLKIWRQTVRAAACKEMGFVEPAGKNIALRLEAHFFLPRAASNKKIDAVQKPDLDKLVRAVLDSMTNVVYEDDCQVCEIHGFKTYGSPRVEITIEEIGMAPTLLKPQAIEDSKIPY